MRGPLAVHGHIMNGFLPGSKLGLGDRAEIQRWHTHHRRSRDPTAWTHPHKHLSIPQQGQQTPTHASVLQPHPSGLCWRFGHGPKLLAGQCSAPPAPSTAALHARAFNGTQGQLGKIWARKADGPFNEAPQWAVNDRADVISEVFWCIFFLFDSVSRVKRNEMKDLIYSMYYILTPTSLPCSGWVHPSLFKPRKAWMQW